MIASIAADIWERIMFALPFLFVLTLVVFIHELGHFLVARWCGVKVKVFSIGFGREIAGFHDRHGTRWRLAWIPLGGYVKFMDDENAASVPSREQIEKMSAEDRQGSFHAKPVWQRAAVVVAGPVANFILAILIFAFWFGIYGVPSTAARVDELDPQGPAAIAGFKVGDEVVRINQEKIATFEDVQKIVSVSAGQELEFEVIRHGERQLLKVTPQQREQVLDGGETVKIVAIGIRRKTTPETVSTYRPGPLEAVWLGVKQTGFIISSTLSWVRDVFVGRQDVDQLGGPARIADMAGKVAKQGFEYVVNFAAWISVSVGLINLFPIPLLDGGHLMFYAIEAVRRRPLSERTQEIGFRIGMAVVVTLMILATFNDLPILKRWLVGTG